MHTLCPHPLSSHPLSSPHPLCTPLIHTSQARRRLEENARQRAGEGAMRLGAAAGPPLGSFPARRPSLAAGKVVELSRAVLRHGCVQS